jgi:hypothetical protein
VRGPSGNRLHGGLWELAHLTSSGDLAAGGFPPCWQIADRVVGRAASPLAARCAHAVLADHNLNIIYYIIAPCQPHAPCQCQPQPHANPMPSPHAGPNPIETPCQPHASPMPAPCQPHANPTCQPHANPMRPHSSGFSAGTPVPRGLTLAQAARPVRWHTAHSSRKTQGGAGPLFLTRRFNRLSGGLVFCDAQNGELLLIASAQKFIGS